MKASFLSYVAVSSVFDILMKYYPYWKMFEEKGVYLRLG